MKVMDILPVFGITWFLLVFIYALLCDKIDKIKEELKNESSN